MRESERKIEETLLYHSCKYVRIYPPLKQRLHDSREFRLVASCHRCSDETGAESDRLECSSQRALVDGRCSCRSSTENSKKRELEIKTLLISSCLSLA